MSFCYTFLFLRYCNYLCDQKIFDATNSRDWYDKNPLHHVSPISLYFYLKIVKIQIQYNNNRHLHCPHWFFFQSNREETFLISIKSFQIPNTFKYIFNLFCSYSIQFNSIPFIFFIWLVNFTYCSEISRVVIIIKKKNKSHSITSIYPSDK